MSTENSKSMDEKMFQVLDKIETNTKLTSVMLVIMVIIQLVLIMKVLNP